MEPNIYKVPLKRDPILVCLTIGLAIAVLTCQDRRN